MTGETLPAVFPDVGEALLAGELGIDSALYVTTALDKVAQRGAGHPVNLAAAEQGIVALATRTPQDLAADAPVATHRDVVDVTEVWVTALDQDGVDPDAERAERGRGVSLGRVRDGLVSLSGYLVPETAAVLQRLFDAHFASPVRFQPHPEEQPADAEWDDTESIPEFRTLTQQRHDALTSILHGAATAPATPRASVSSLPRRVRTADGRVLCARLSGTRRAERRRSRRSCPAIPRPPRCDHDLQNACAPAAGTIRTRALQPSCGPHARTR
ncbi:DUF222 domain-containing protein [Microbacterium amylolyticum]|uniref:DUF222 domain-containing protein n=1 Tax=Microbacterium amylolyticum TaxID=936337 RepID=UPI003CC97B16